MQNYNYIIYINQLEIIACHKDETILYVVRVDLVVTEKRKSKD